MAEGGENCGNTIVIHPGSLHLRIGRASDPAPHRLIHCVARRRREGGLEHRDSLLIPRVPRYSVCPFPPFSLSLKKHFAP